MRFEVDVDDGANLDALHKARDAWNTANPNTQCPDMPSFVQTLANKAVAEALDGLGEPTTLSAALDQIAKLKASNATLSQEVAAATAAPATSAQAPATPG